MKRPTIRNRIFFAGIAIAVVVVAGCAAPLSDVQGDSRGTLTVRFDDPAITASTILPESFNVATYGILLQTAANDDITASGIADSTYTLTDVPVREWTVTVFAYDSAGTEIGRSAETSVAVTTGTNSVSVPITLATDGTGTVNVSYSWPSDLVDGAEVAATTYPAGETIDLSGLVTVDTVGGTAQVNGEIGGGTYLLSLSMSKNGVSHPAIREILHIYNGHTSEKTISVTAAQLNAVPPAPTNLTVSMPDTETVSLSWTDNSDVESAYKVYRDGTLLETLSANVTSYSDTITSLGSMPGAYRVEVENAIGLSDVSYAVPSVSSVAFSAPAYPLASAGDTASTTLSFTPTDPLNQFVNYDSSDPLQVSVDGDGVVTLESADGEATITVTTDDGGKTATVPVGFIPKIEIDAHEAVGYGIQTGFAATDAGGNHTVALGTDGTLYTWGDNYYGQLGDGSSTDRWTTTVLGSGYTHVSAGSDHTLAITSDGELYAWGYNRYKQLGDGTSTWRYTPVLIGTGFSFVSGGYWHSVGIKTDGTLWAWGNNGYGQLGDGTNTDRSSPVQIGSDTDWESVSAGRYHTVAVKTDGTLWAWGDNGYGQLGDGTNTDRLSPAQIGSATDWDSVAAGNYFTLALTESGDYYGWGDNSDGQLVDGTTTQTNSVPGTAIGSDFVSVAAGGDHSLAIDTAGELWAGGDNYYYQVGDGTNTDRSSAVQIGSDTDWAGVAAGGAFSVAVKSNGTVYGWGSNSSGKLGDGTTTQRTTPTPVRNRIVEAGNEVTVDIRVKNTGVTTALGLSGTMSSTSDYVTGFSSETFSFGTLATDYYRTVTDETPTSTDYHASLSAVEAEAFVFTLSAETPPGTEIPMTVTFTDESNRTWTDTFTVAIPE